MISVIVCSTNTAEKARFLESLSSTIGVVYEIIIIDNKAGAMGICEAYNKGILQANFDILCFCHEDIVFNTSDWGFVLSAILEDSSIGLAGVAGAMYKSKTPGSWTSTAEKYYRINMVQKKNGDTTETHRNTSPGFTSEVVVLDGCFIAGKKQRFVKYPWNESFLKAFHLYDIDICLRIGRMYKLVVANTIQITHFSEGRMDTSWLRESERFHKEYASLLPASISTIEKKEQKELEYYAHYRYVLLLIQMKRSLFDIYTKIIKGFLMAPGKRENISLIKQSFLSLK
jgi:glycosyltransferase involved in cell wall biosynthesis